MSDAFPAIEELVRHSGPMCLLSRVLAHTPDETVCRVDPERSTLFADELGRVPAWLGIEYMAQCVAAHGGLVARAHGEAPRPGLFLGSRRVEIRAADFEPGHALDVSVRHVRGTIGLTAFEGVVAHAAGGEPIVSGRLNVYVARDAAELGIPE